MSTSSDAIEEAPWRLPMLAILVVSALYVLGQIDRGWIPSDDGLLGHTAERLIGGELPHRDFDDMYTGGLTWLHAWAFQLFGDRLGTLRAVLFVAFVAWVPAVQYVGTRFQSPWPAALVTALCVTWSVPNYPASMPSWYNLFLATFGAAALLRFVEVRRTRWLILAGMAGGLSITVKIVGVYFVAAGLLSLVLIARDDDQMAPEGGSNRWIYPAVITSCLVVFVLALLSIIRQAIHAREVVNFVLPGALLAAALVRREWRSPRPPGQFAGLLRVVIPFMIGVAIPIAILLIPYLTQGAVDDLVRGVFILPQRRLKWAYDPPLPLWTLNVAVWVLVAGWLLNRRQAPLPRAALLAAGAFFVAALWFVGREGNSYRIVWFAVRGAGVVAVAGAALRIARSSGNAEPRNAQQRLMIVASTLACCSLVQFPFATPVYFCYAAPLAILAILPWVSRGSPALKQGAAIVALFLTGFAAVRVNGTLPQYMGRWYVPPIALEPLPGEKGGILVPTDHALLAPQLIDFLRQKARGGYTWASPDAPEIYYLTGLKNPTRTMYDFFDDAPDREARVMAAIDAHGVTAVALNQMPYFSPPISRSMYTALSRRYPYGRRIGSFVVLWRD